VEVAIPGAGQAGACLAASLVCKDHHITLVDTDGANLTYLQDRHDLCTLPRHAERPSVAPGSGTD
jgi:Trk K+ transport system NAD-binding subunit